MEELIKMLKMAKGDESKTIAMAKGLYRYEGLGSSFKKLLAIKKWEDN